MQSQPYIVTIAPQHPQQVTIRDVILNAFGVTGVLVLIAVVLGVVMAFVLVRWHRRHPPELDHLPSINPLAPGTDARPSSPAR